MTETAKPKPASAPEPEPERFDAEYMLDHSRAFFKESRHMVAGAIALRGGSRKTFSVDEVKDFVRDYRKHVPEQGV
jgi:hypothetical protein